MAEPIHMALDEEIMFGYLYERMIPLCEKFVLAKYRGIHGISELMIFIEKVTKNKVTFSIRSANVNKVETLPLSYFAESEQRKAILQVVEGLACSLINDFGFTHPAVQHTSVDDTPLAASF
jgi:hypothetical protein